MLILNAINKNIEVVLGGAVTTNELPIVASFVDIDVNNYTPGSTDTETDGATPVIAVAAPPASTQRQVKLLTVKNEDTVDADVSVQLDSNGTTRGIVTVTLEPGSTLVYTDGEGWRVVNTLGQMLTSATATGGGSGDVVGPASATDERIAVFDGGTGKLIKDGGMTIADILAMIGGGGGVVDFIDLGDVPGAYTGEGGKLVAVKVAEDGLEFVVMPASAEIKARVETSFEGPITGTRYTSTVVSTGTNTISQSGLSNSTGGTAGAESILEWRAGNNLNPWELLPARIGFTSWRWSSASPPTDLNSFIGAGQPSTNGAGTFTFTADHIGFKVTRTASGAIELRATQGDGAAETASAALTTVANGDVFDFYVDIVSPTLVNYYYRKNLAAWSGPTALTANVPTSASHSGPNMGLSAMVGNRGTSGTIAQSILSMWIQR